MNGPHSHVCPIHNERKPCQVVTHCSLPYYTVCLSEHPRDMLQAYVDRVRKEHNDEVRELERDARAAYREGRQEERESQDERL